MTGFIAALARRGEFLGLSKISVQTGTAHGGFLNFFNSSDAGTANITNQVITPNLGFDMAFPEGVLGLERGDGVDLMRPANGGRRRLGET